MMSVSFDLAKKKDLTVRELEEYAPKGRQILFDMYSQPSQKERVVALANKCLQELGKIAQRAGKAFVEPMLTEEERKACATIFPSFKSWDNMYSTQALEDRVWTVCNIVGTLPNELLPNASEDQKRDLESFFLYKFLKEHKHVTVNDYILNGSNKTDARGLEKFLSKIEEGTFKSPTQKEISKLSKELEKMKQNLQEKEKAHKVLRKHILEIIECLQRAKNRVRSKSGKESLNQTINIFCNIHAGLNEGRDKDYFEDLKNQLDSCTWKSWANDEEKGLIQGLINGWDNINNWIAGKKESEQEIKEIKNNIAATEEKIDYLKSNWIMRIIKSITKPLIAIALKILFFVDRFFTDIFFRFLGNN